MTVSELSEKLKDFNPDLEVVVMTKEGTTTAITDAIDIETWDEVDTPLRLTVPVVDAVALTVDEEDFV